MQVWGYDAYWRFQEPLKKKLPLSRASFPQPTLESGLGNLTRLDLTLFFKEKDLRQNTFLRSTWVGIANATTERFKLEAFSEEMKEKYTEGEGRHVAC